ncbi:MAG: hypothetical protein IKY33_04600 [Clostridia bacterium]|nr:hypothetical protein [Clostridia bacterium]
MKEQKTPKEMPGYSHARQPHDSFDLINMYGTYNIQPTADHGNEYPAIAQGLSREEAKERRRSRELWKKEQAKKPKNGGHLEADPAKGHDGSIPDLLNDREEI